MKIKTLALAIFISITTLAQNVEETKMDSLFSIIENNDKGMGSISIVKNGKEVYQNTVGYLNIKKQIPINKNTKFRIGSISKTFTATIIIKLVEQDKLSLDTKLAKFFPQITNAEKITIEHLLKHRSGIYNFTNATDYVSWMEQSITRDELLKKIAANGNVFDPDEKTEYSNANFVLLSFIAEDLTGKDFSEILKDFITQPCALKHTYFGSAIKTENNEALSYNKLNEWELSTETDMSVPMGAGGIVSTSKDLNIFLNCLFNYKIVNKESLNKMMDIQDGMGMGLFQVPFYERKAFGHTGGIDGFQSNAFYFPDENVSVAYLSNGVVMPMNDILIGVLSIYFGRDYELPEFKEALKLTSEELDKYLGIYSSPDFPLKLTITKKDNILLGQGTGQPSFPLEAYDEHKFKFDQASLKVEFFPHENKLILKQGGGVFELTKEE
ncbi:MAG TPA: serine hydrolase domain-containing protein [Bacteroidales bacterium]|nr:serine hydrolase domain-containing protein [Bacteroidales bacterium]